MTDQTGIAQITQARQALAEAKTLEEVSSVLSFAEAAAVFAKKARLGIAAQNEAAEIAIRARRKAGEMLEQIPRSSGGRPEKNSDPRIGVSTFAEQRDDAGITEGTGKRMEKLARVPEAEFERAIAAVHETESSDEPIEMTTAVVERIARGAHVAHNSGDNEWYTPALIIDAARSSLGGHIGLDPASCAAANLGVGALSFYDAETDGLAMPWPGRVWLNPPYAQPLMGLFAAKLIAEVDCGHTEAACVLTNNATETQWGTALLDACSWVCFPAGRIRFHGPDGEKGAPLQGQMITGFGAASPEPFESIGVILRG